MAFGFKEEVMLHLGREIDEALPRFLKPVEEIWQPADLLPVGHSDTFIDDIKILQERAGNLSYDLMAVLIGDTITEEALPSYETWLSNIVALDTSHDSGWQRWIRGWTAEENRHGDVLNRYLYLSGRVDMKSMEISTQHLIADGFDPQTANDPYKSFVYTSFQELATNISHRRVAAIAKKEGEDVLARLCGNIAADEARHALAYKSFVSSIIALDSTGMIIAFEAMMKANVAMPAVMMREQGETKGAAFAHFAEAAQRIGVYTTTDYIDIFLSLIKEWDIASIRDLNDNGERARDYIMALPARLTRLAERSKPQTGMHKFNWIVNR